MCRYDPSPFVTLLPEAENWTVMAAGRYVFSPALEILRGGVVHAPRHLHADPAGPLSDQFTLPPSNPLFAVPPFNGVNTFLLRPTSPYYPAWTISRRRGFDPTQPVLVRYRAQRKRVSARRAIRWRPRALCSA